MEKKKKEQWEKDVIKVWVAIGIAIFAFICVPVFGLLRELEILDETLGWIFILIWWAIFVVFVFYGVHILGCHAVPEKSTLEEGDIESKNFEEFMDNVSNNLSNLPPKSYKYEDHLHNPIVLNQGNVYTYVLVQKKDSMKIFVFMHVTDFNKFDLKREFTTIWNRICGEIKDLFPEICSRMPLSYGGMTLKRIIYIVCVDKQTEDFQQYLDDNAGKYNAKGNGAFFIDMNNYDCRYSKNIKLEAGICFETQKRYHLVPGSLNNVWHGRMRKYFLEIMKDC